MKIERELTDEFVSTFTKGVKQGVILAGTVGSGKTTLIKHAIQRLKEKFDVFEFTGDDSLFREQVSSNTKYLVESIKSKTNRPVFIYVDEVQKSESIFDAIKYAYDKIDASFVVSGSNPAYLQTVARSRLQRRARFIEFFPFAIPEILKHKNLVSSEHLIFSEILLNWDKGKKINFDLTLLPDTEKVIKDFFVYGGYPESYLQKKKMDRFIEIQKIVERGFELQSLGNEDHNTIIRIELARNHSQEFSYQHFFQKTGLRRRDHVNKVIDAMINHGYLVKKSPSLLCKNKRSYLTIYSYIDPGVVSYLTGNTSLAEDYGRLVEGVCHTRLHQILQRYPLRSELGYYKFHTIDGAGKIKYAPGEIDFIVQVGDRVVPIEVKSCSDMATIRCPNLIAFTDENDLPFGIVLYGGLPYWDKDRKIIFWPYWLV